MLSRCNVHRCVGRTGRPTLSELSFLCRPFCFCLHVYATAPSCGWAAAGRELPKHRFIVATDVADALYTWTKRLQLWGSYKILKCK